MHMPLQAGEIIVRLLSLFHAITLFSKATWGILDRIVKALMEYFKQTCRAPIHILNKVCDT